MPYRNAPHRFADRIKTAFHAWKRCTSGIAAVETALVLPIFVGLLFPPLEYARYIYTKRVMISGVNEGARFAAFTSSDPASTMNEEAIRSVVVSNLGMFAPLREDIAVTFEPDMSPGSRVTVMIDVPFETVTDVFGNFRIQARGARTLF